MAPEFIPKPGSVKNSIAKWESRLSSTPATPPVTPTTKPSDGGEASNNPVSIEGGSLTSSSKRGHDASGSWSSSKHQGPADPINPQLFDAKYGPTHGRFVWLLPESLPLSTNKAHSLVQAFETTFGPLSKAETARIHNEAMLCEKMLGAWNEMTTEGRTDGDDQARLSTTCSLFDAGKADAWKKSPMQEAYVQRFSKKAIAERRASNPSNTSNPTESSRSMDKDDIALAVGDLNYAVAFCSEFKLLKRPRIGAPDRVTEVMREAVYQNLWYLAGYHYLTGTQLGLVMVSSRFCRLWRLDAETVLIEASEDVVADKGDRRLKFRDFVDYSQFWDEGPCHDLCPLSTGFAHDVFEILWSTMRAAYQFAATMPRKFEPGAPVAGLIAQPEPLPFEGVRAKISATKVRSGGERIVSKDIMGVAQLKKDAEKDSKNARAKDGKLGPRPQTEHIETHLSSDSEVGVKTESPSSASASGVDLSLEQPRSKEEEKPMEELIWEEEDYPSILHEWTDPVFPSPFRLRPESQSSFYRRIRSSDLGYASEAGSSNWSTTDWISRSSRSAGSRSSQGSYPSARQSGTSLPNTPPVSISHSIANLSLSANRDSHLTEVAEVNEDAEEVAGGDEELEGGGEEKPTGGDEDVEMKSDDEFEDDEDQPLDLEIVLEVLGNQNVILLTRTDFDRHMNEQVRLMQRSRS